MLLCVRALFVAVVVEAAILQKDVGGSAAENNDNSNSNSSSQLNLERQRRKSYSKRLMKVSRDSDRASAPKQF